jgi:streptomycin 3"-adenylyltransferase
LHGSLALGCYNRALSDIDLLFVADAELNTACRGSLAEVCIELSDGRPDFGDVELSVLRMDELAAFRHPLPFEFHWGEEHREEYRAGEVDLTRTRTDADLAAHLTVARSRGVTLLGPSPREVCAPVPWEDYVSSVVGDLDWIVEYDHFRESPVYSVLNCCRVLRMLALGEGTIESKDEAGERILASLPERHRPLVTAALDTYRNARDVAAAVRKTAGREWDAGALARFQEWVARERVRMTG